MELRLVNDKTIQYEEFEVKKENLIKVRLHDCDQDVESIWAVVSDETKKAIDSNQSTRSPEHVASLRNAALMFYPANSWGWIIPIKLCGSDIPECDVNWVADDEEVGVNMGSWEENKETTN
jgi:hypothetical protein